MNKSHTIAATVASIVGALLAAEAPALRVLVSNHPTVTGIVVAVLSAVLGALPSSVGVEP